MKEIRGTVYFKDKKPTFNKHCYDFDKIFTEEVLKKSCLVFMGNNIESSNYDNPKHPDVVGFIDNLQRIDDQITGVIKIIDPVLSDIIQSNVWLGMNGTGCWESDINKENIINIYDYNLLSFSIMDEDSLYDFDLYSMPSKYRNED